MSAVALIVAFIGFMLFLNGNAAMAGLLMFVIGSAVSIMDYFLKRRNRSRFSPYKHTTPEQDKEVQKYLDYIRENS